MKLSFFYTLLSLGILIGCSHVQDLKRGPASVGVIATGGGVGLYYRDGDYIVLQLCGRNTILGNTPAEARSNCQGKSFKVPVETFKDAIRKMVFHNLKNILKPLTPEEVEAYSLGGPTSEKIQAMIIELERINNFIAVYCEDEASLVRKEELINALRTHEALAIVTDKVNAEVEKAVNRIADQTKLTITKANSDNDQFLYTVLSQFNPNQKFPCGFKGSVDERIKDCSYQPTSMKDGFVLVTRSKDFKEVYKEVSTGLLWSHRLPRTMTHYDAEKTCSGFEEVAGITGYKWRLPSKKDFELADKNGIRHALPNMEDNWFWSSSVKFMKPDLAWKFGSLSYITHYQRKSYGSVLCVAR
jgi:hypothetical protein